MKPAPDALLVRLRAAAGGYQVMVDQDTTMDGATCFKFVGRRDEARIITIVVPVRDITVAEHSDEEVDGIIEFVRLAHEARTTYLY